VGVYLGRPVRGWTYQKIMKELGPIDYYVHERLNLPLVVTDDDVAGTFTFIRARRGLWRLARLSAETLARPGSLHRRGTRDPLVGRQWQLPEHTAWLKPQARRAGAGVRLHCDQRVGRRRADRRADLHRRWGNGGSRQPALAAKLAEQAGKVSHDGESVYARCSGGDGGRGVRLEQHRPPARHGLGTIPRDSLIAKVIADIRAWQKANPDWRDTRQRIEEKYGYDKYPGNCHVVPNHAADGDAVLYAPDDFQKAQMIVNTSGWDTDCNAGNVGCLLGIMNGLDGLDEGPTGAGRSPTGC